MDVGPQEATREFRQGVAEIDDCVVAQGFHMDPSAGLLDALVVDELVWETHLEAAHAVEKDGDGTEVGVFAEGDSLVVGIELRGRVHEAHLVS